MTRIFAKDTKDIRTLMIPEVDDRPTSIFCVSVHPDSIQNKEIRIPMHKCLPIDGYIYNHINDRYTSYGVDYVPLGYIPVSYRVRIEGVGRWGMHIPMPEAALKRYMTTDQRRAISQFKASQRMFNPEFQFDFIQMLGAYQQ